MTKLASRVPTGCLARAVPVGRAQIAGAEDVHVLRAKPDGRLVGDLEVEVATRRQILVRGVRHLERHRRVLDLVVRLAVPDLAVEDEVAAERGAVVDAEVPRRLVDHVVTDVLAVIERHPLEPSEWATLNENPIPDWMPSIFLVGNG